jgi:hypothetical protein
MLAVAILNRQGGLIGIDASPLLVFPVVGEGSIPRPGPAGNKRLAVYLGSR